MRQFVFYLCSCVILNFVTSCYCCNVTELGAASQQLPEFRFRQPRPIEVLTKVSGEPLDIRDTITLNTDIFGHRNHFRFTSHHVRERIPERIVHAKGIGAFGYFEVTHDVSKYIKSDVFNGIGKRTPLAVRFSSVVQNIGGTDLSREAKAAAFKFYTKEGNLDLIGLNLPIFLLKDPIIFPHVARVFKRNPRTDLRDTTAIWDFINNFTDVLHTILWLASDLGIPNGYRKADAFPIHTYQIYNKYGDAYYVKFNFKTEIGLFNLTTAQARAIGTQDPDYFNTDLYNAIAAKDYPSWRLEMDILTMEDLLKVDYDPFDVTRLWKRGTYKTLNIGRVVLNKRVDNNFRDVEQAAYSPDNLVPGITGPLDNVYRARKLSYPDSQNYRLGANFDNILVNAPLYKTVYNRDGNAPLDDNMRDAPNYFPNSYNGPMPYVDEARPKQNILVYNRNAIDLQPMAEFYNEIVDSDEHRQRIANNLGQQLVIVTKDVEMNALRILTLIDKDLGRRVKLVLAAAKANNVNERRNRVAQCIENVTRLSVDDINKLHT